MSFTGMTLSRNGIRAMAGRRPSGGTMSSFRFTSNRGHQPWRSSSARMGHFTVWAGAMSTTGADRWAGLSSWPTVRSPMLNFPTRYPIGADSTEVGPVRRCPNDRYASLWMLTVAKVLGRNQTRALRSARIRQGLTITWYGKGPRFESGRGLRVQYQRFLPSSPSHHLPRNDVRKCQPQSFNASRPSRRSGRGN
jgi:hypothetical protein